MFFAGVILGIVNQRNPDKSQPIDILGFGLVGNRGLFIYVNFLIVLGLCIGGLIVAVKRGMLWTRPLQRALLRIPAIGNALERIALARLSWALPPTDTDRRRWPPVRLSGISRNGRA